MRSTPMARPMESPCHASASMARTLLFLERPLRLRADARVMRGAMEARIVVVGTDFGETGDHALRVGLEQLASGVAQGMYAVYVLETGARLQTPEEPDVGPDARTVKVVLESLARRMSEIATREGLPYHADLVRMEVRKGEVREALLDAAREHHADLIIVGTHGREGVERWVVGSIAETLVRSAECSVLVARPKRHAPLPKAPAAREWTSGTASEVDVDGECPENAAPGDKPWRHTRTRGSTPKAG
jgi:nucleotide-binding universal stress UspA family protein